MKRLFDIGFLVVTVFPLLIVACPHQDIPSKQPWATLDADTDALFVPYTELPTPRPLPVITDAEVAACAKLRTLNCPEGRPPRGTCEESLQEARADGVLIPANCLANSWDKASVRTCGGPGYLTVACP